VPPVCYVHVGGYKTGTTYVQRRLFEGRDLLRAKGVLVPGRRGGVGTHVLATRVILGRNDLKDRPVPPSAWYDLRDEMLAFDGHSAVFTTEELSAASEDQAARMVADLDGADVRIVLTTRDLVRVIPAAWQELMKGGNQWTWPQYVDTLASRLGRAVPPGKTFWRMHDWASLAARWAGVVGPDKITIVTVPPAGSSPELLWQRYCAAIDADPAVLPPDLQPKNESLDAAAAELLRRFNMRAADGLPPDVYVREIRKFLAGEVLSTRSEVEPFRLGAERNSWARAEGARIAADLARLGVRVEGDLDDLVGTPDDRPPPPTPTAEEVLDAAVLAIDALVTRLAERTATEEQREARRRRRGKTDPPPGSPDRAAAPAVASTQTPAKVLARRLANRLLRETYERTRR
jgi:hypothetical protein